MTAVSLGSLLYEGKAKRVFQTAAADVVAVEFKDDTTAFNAIKKAQLEGKGTLNCQISALLFEHLERQGCPPITWDCSNRTGWRCGRCG